MKIDYEKLADEINEHFEKPFEPPTEWLLNELIKALKWLVGQDERMTAIGKTPVDAGGRGAYQEYIGDSEPIIQNDHELASHFLKIVLSAEYEPPMDSLLLSAHLWYLWVFIRGSQRYASRDVLLRAHINGMKTIAMAQILWVAGAKIEEDERAKISRRKAKLEKIETLDRQESLFAAAERYLSSHKKLPPLNHLKDQVIRLQQQEYAAGNGPKPYAKTQAKKLLKQKYYSVVVTT